MNYKKTCSTPLELNDAQKEAVLTTNGRLLVLAGAGSGKTRVIIQRIAHLINNLQVPPSAILGLTFTNKAAQEMRERLSHFIDKKLAVDVTLCTFHSFCMQLLRKEIHRLGFGKNFTLYDEQDIYRLSQQLAADILKTPSEIPSIANILQSISFAKNKGMDISNLPSIKSKWHGDFLKELSERLAVSMRAYNALDFDSLITLSIELFEKHPDVLTAYQERFRYIMIDEYQDTNPAQYKLAELLSAKSQNLCVVGDDDQSIYEWRGAEVSHILHFRYDKVVRLEQNFRSNPTILEIANSVIAHNKKRHPKKLWTAKKEDEKVLIFNAATDVEESDAVAQKILNLKKEKNLAWGDIAILYRSNAISRNFELALNKTPWDKDGKWFRGIPYEIYGGLEFNLRGEIKDLNAYLRVIANPLDQEALLRIINVPRRGISEGTLDALTSINRKENIPLWNVLENSSLYQDLELQERSLKGINAFVSLIKKAQEVFAKETITKALTWFIEEVNYKKAIEEDVKSSKGRDFKWENVQEFVNSAAHYEEFTSKEEISLINFLSSTCLKEEEITSKHSQDKVKLMTFHSAKGLEFRACFLVALEDGVLPHERALAENGEEEERRLFYVAITRAKEFLTLSMARSRKKMGEYTATNPSRFLFEIPTDLLKVTSVKF